MTGLELTVCLLLIIVLVQALLIRSYRKEIREVVAVSKKRRMYW